MAIPPPLDSPPHCPSTHPPPCPPPLLQVRYQHGKFAAAAARIVTNDLRMTLEVWRRRAAGHIISTAYAGRAFEHAFATAFLRLHARCASVVASEALMATSAAAARERRLKKLFTRLRALAAPGGPWQLRQIAGACSAAYSLRKGLARWQKYCFRVLCTACAVQHDTSRRVRTVLGCWVVYVRGEAARRAQVPTLHLQPRAWL